LDRSSSDRGAGRVCQAGKFFEMFLGVRRVWSAATRGANEQGALGRRLDFDQSRNGRSSIATS
jgi:hypothetical protein